MSVRHLADVVTIGLDVLKTTLSTATNLITAQLGNVVAGESRSDDAEWWQHVGFASRPRVPDGGSKSAQVVVITRADHDAVVASRDERAASIYGALDDGETAVFSSVVGGGVAIFKKDGSITITGGTVTIGDANAVALAQAKAISDLQTAINGWVPVSNDGGAALKAKLTAWLTANYATTKIKGT